MSFSVDIRVKATTWAVCTAFTKLESLQGPLLLFLKQDANAISVSLFKILGHVNIGNKDTNVFEIPKDVWNTKNCILAATRNCGTHQSVKPLVVFVYNKDFLSIRKTMTLIFIKYYLKIRTFQIDSHCVKSTWDLFIFPQKNIH